MRREGLDWLSTGENEDYFAEEILVVNSREKQDWTDAAQQCYNDMLATAQKAIAAQEWGNLGIPQNARRLVEYSFANELDNFLLGRFDFAGGFDDFPIKLLEFNADTCTLIPETAHVQRHLWVEMPRRKKKGTGPFDPLLASLIEQFKQLLKRYPDREPNILFSSMGYEEDQINLDVLVEAAQKAGFKQVHQINLEAVIFDPEEGIFIEIGEERFISFDFWYKLFPWDFIATEEPELMDLLTDIAISGKAIILNPAWTMALQTKALLPFLHRDHPHKNTILKASFSSNDFADGRYVQKPIFGRIGENILLFDGKRQQPAAQTEGDYSEMPVIYQELAGFSNDVDGYRYQASVFFTNYPCALSFRRQDDLIIDDDAEFIAHTIEDNN